MKHRFLMILLSLLLIFSLTSCKGEAVVTEAPETTEAAEKPAPEEAEWAVYWYLCGSNLESGSQSATNDLSEMLSEKLPKDVKVVIQTGGSRSWHSKGITADGMYRFTAENGKLQKQEKLPLENMGDAKTLSEFITYCITEHPAKHTMLILWDHGGGTLGGVSYDMNYNMDSVMLPELKEALATALPDGKKLDIIGFDACLMSSIDMVEACMGHADYLISSQQLEPVCGWDYQEIAKKLNGAGSLTPEELGKAVCDTYYASCEKEKLAEIATLSLVDLNKAEGVVWHYDEMIKAMFDEALQSDEKAASIRRAAYGSENYGENGRDIGYTDMVDLKGFATAIEGFAGETFLELIDSSVVYQVRGDISPEGCGISCYYPLDASLRSVLQYAQAAGSDTDVSLFYKYMLSPEYDGQVEAYAGEQNITKAMREMRYEVTELNLGGIEKSVLTMDPTESKRLSNVRVAANRMTVGEKGYTWTELGEVPCTSFDYNNGKFGYDGNFRSILGDDSSFATYVYSEKGNILNCYSPAVIDGKDAVLLFTADTLTGEVQSNGAVTGKEHSIGRYDPTGVEEKKAAEEEFTEEELRQFQKEFGKEGTYEEQRRYILSERALKNRNFASPIGKVPGTETKDVDAEFVNNRVIALRENQVITPLFRETESSMLSNRHTGSENWKEGEPIVIGRNTKFRLESYGDGVTFNFIVTDAWGNEEITESFEASREEEIVEETEPETETETEPPTEPETRRPEPRTEAPTTAPVPVTEPETTIEETTAPPESLPNSTEYYYSDYDDDDDDDYYHEPETPAPTQPPTEAPTEPPETNPPETEPPETEPPETNKEGGSGGSSEAGNGGAESGSSGGGEAEGSGSGGGSETSAPWENPNNPITPVSGGEWGTTAAP